MCNPLKKKHCSVSLVLASACLLIFLTLPESTIAQNQDGSVLISFLVSIESACFFFFAIADKSAVSQVFHECGTCSSYIFEQAIVLVAACVAGTEHVRFV